LGGLLATKWRIKFEIARKRRRERKGKLKRKEMSRQVVAKVVAGFPLAFFSHPFSFFAFVV